MRQASRRSSTRRTKNFTSAANTAYRDSDNAGSSRGKWITADHTGMSRAMIDMQSMGFWDTLYYIVTHFLIAVFGALVSGLLMFLLIFIGIPLLIQGVL